jgi:putative transposase
MTMTKSDPERGERRQQQKEVAESLKQSGALDEIFARIDAGESLTGHEGLLKGMLKASLERGLEAELSDHVGYDGATQTPPSSRTRATARSPRDRRCRAGGPS